MASNLYGEKPMAKSLGQKAHGKKPGAQSPRQKALWGQCPEYARVVTASSPAYKRVPVRTETQSQAKA